MKRKVVLDDNGTESLLELRMRQPVAIDLDFTVSIFTTKLSSINKFNEMINRKFAARPVYIQPNGHFMPMVLDSISDKSDYNIDDRQFYSQSYDIKVMAYIITEDDYRIEEKALKILEEEEPENKMSYQDYANSLEKDEENFKEGKGKEDQGRAAAYAA